MPCPYDFFSENRSSACSACPANSTGPGQTVAYGCGCNPGFYPYYRTRGAGGAESVLGATFKQHVFAGGAGVFVLYIQTLLSLYCDTTYLGQFTWQPGTYTLNYACTQLTVGYSISGSFYAGLSPTYFLCQPCAAGTYNVNQSTCAACPAGSTSLIASSTCSACAPGTIAAAPGTPACSPCAGGYYDTGTQTLCAPCAPGLYAPGSTTSCLACPDNTYSSGAAPACGPCPYFSISLGGATLTGCLCEAGYLRQLIPFFVCYPCPTGTFSIVNATACASCDPGFYSLSAATTCDTCPAGTYQALPASASCEPCPPGYLADAGSTVCQACPPPLYCAGDGQFAECPLGTYSDLYGLQAITDCPICPANSFCVTSSQIEACPDHTSSPQGSESILGCQCNPGYVCTYTKAVRVNITLPLTQA